MEPRQNLTPTPLPTDEEIIPRPYSELTAVQQYYVDFKALNGITIEPDTGAIKRLTVTDLADMLHVTRQAIYDSVKYVPNFWDLVDQRRKELSAQTRLANVYNAWYLMATNGKSWQATEAYIRNFGTDYKEPKQKLEHDIGDGLADALNIARERKLKSENIQEGEIVEDAQA